MFRCRKGGKDPTPRKEGAGNPSKSAGHMLEERETRVLYYSRAAPRYNVNPPLRFLIQGGSGLLLALVHRNGISRVIRGLKSRAYALSPSLSIFSQTYSRLIRACLECSKWINAKLSLTKGAKRWNCSKFSCIISIGGEIRVSTRSNDDRKREARFVTDTSLSPLSSTRDATILEYEDTCIRGAGGQGSKSTRSSTGKCGIERRRWIPRKEVFRR